MTMFKQYINTKIRLAVMPNCYNKLRFILKLGINPRDKN